MGNTKTKLHGLTSLKCNTRQRAQGSLPANGALNSDQAISLRTVSYTHLTLPTIYSV